jgi:hypothetical protein
MPVSNIAWKDSRRYPEESLEKFHAYKNWRNLRLWNPKQ